MISLAKIRSLDRAEAVYLLEVQLVGEFAPVLHLAERDMVVDSVRYESYLSEVHGLQYLLDLYGPAGRSTGMGFSILNEPWRGYARISEAGEEFTFEGAGITLSETYIGLDGEPALPELLFSGVIDGIASINLVGFQLIASGLWPVPM